MQLMIVESQVNVHITLFVLQGFKNEAINTSIK